MSLVNITISRILKIQLFLIIVIFCFSFLLDYNNLQHATNTSKQIHEIDQPALLAAISLRTTLHELGKNIGFFVVTKNDENRKSLEKHSNQFANQLLELDKIVHKNYYFDTNKQGFDSGGPINLIIENDIKKHLDLFSENSEKLTSYKEHLYELANDELRNYPARKMYVDFLEPRESEVQNYFSDIETELTDLSEHEFYPLIINNFYELRYVWLSFTKSANGYITTSNQAEMSDLNLFKATVASNLSNYISYMQNFESEDAIYLLEELEMEVQQYEIDLDKVIKLSISDESQRDSFLVKHEIGPLINTMSETLDDLVSQVLATTKSRQDKLEENLNISISQNTLFSIAALIIVTLLVYYVSKLINRLILRVQHGFSELSSGNMLVRLNENDVGEIGVIGRYFNDLARQLESLNKNLWNRAHYDSLTGLANRTLFEDRLLVSIAQAKRADTHIALLFLDLDNFKTINDTMGHEAGDEILIETASRLNQIMREEDTVARQGGDEFTIMMRVNNRQEVDAIASRILEAMRQAFILDNEEMYIGVSIGAAFYPDDCDNMSDLKRLADMAMYSAKESGKNNFRVFNEELQFQSTNLLTHEQEILHAINGNELCLYYQPIINPADQSVSHLEALLRWQHPVKGLVGPMEFLPQAEELGLMDQIDSWVICKSISQLNEWKRNREVNTPITINLSIGRSNDSSMIKIIESSLADTDIDPSMFNIEISENSIIDRTNSSTIDLLNKLSDMGIGLLLDDFGTGYSSLNYLTDLPVKFVKIDKSLISDIDSNFRNREITQSVVNLAHKFDLIIIAEGVETEEQLRKLIELKCDYVQGYLYSRPVPPVKVPEIIASGFDLDSDLLEPISDEVA